MGVITKVTSGGVKTAKYSDVRFTTKYLQKNLLEKIAREKFGRVKTAFDQLSNLPV
jgi:hypothetical protein